MTVRRPYSRHGLSALKARVKVRGFQAIDRRTAAAQALLGWQKDLLADLGGEAAISAQQLALVELATRTRLYVDHLDAWLMEQPSLVNAKRRAVHPILRERQQLVDSLTRLLQALGLERKARQVPSLQDYLAAKYGQDGEGEESDPREDGGHGLEGGGVNPSVTGVTALHPPEDRAGEP